MDYIPTPARHPICLPPLRGLRPAAQRYPSPPLGRPGAAANPALVVPGLSQQCLALLSGVTSRQRPQSFWELVADLYVYSVGFRGLARILDLLGCGVGALWRDVPAMPPGRRPDPQAGLAGGGRDLAVHRWRKATGGRGPGAQGPAAGPAVEWSRLRRGRLVHGSGPAGARAAHAPHLFLFVPPCAPAVWGAGRVGR